MKFNDITLIHSNLPVVFIEFQTTLCTRASGSVKCQGAALRVATLMGGIYDMIYLLTALGLSHSGSTQVHTSNT
jgi:hypothetical protein